MGPHLERAYAIRVELAGGEMEGIQLFEEAVKDNREHVLWHVTLVSLPPFQKIIILLLIDEKKPALDLIIQTISFNESFEIPVRRLVSPSDGSSASVKPARSQTQRPDGEVLQSSQ